MVNIAVALAALDEVLRYYERTHVLTYEQAGGIYNRAAEAMARAASVQAAPTPVSERETLPEIPRIVGRLASRHGEVDIA